MQAVQHHGLHDARRGRDVHRQDRWKQRRSVRSVRLDVHLVHHPRRILDGRPGTERRRLPRPIPESAIFAAASTDGKRRNVRRWNGNAFGRRGRRFSPGADDLRCCDRCAPSNRWHRLGACADGSGRCHCGALSDRWDRKRSCSDGLWCSHG